MAAGNRTKIEYKEILKHPAVERDLSLVLPADTPFQLLEQSIRKAKIAALTNWQLFDQFTGEKVGDGKKSLAIRLLFQHQEKTLTDKEVDADVEKILSTITSDLGANLRQ